MSSSKIAVQRLSDTIAHELERRILEGSLKPGDRLQAERELAAELGEQRLTAEVNEDPPNPQSMAFHEKLGFRHLLSRMSRSGKVVAMLERPL